MTESIIFHVDVNSAFLSWEACYRKETIADTVDLREIPSVIGGDIEKRKGVILAKSIPAKQYGVQTGEPVIAAVKKCPALTIVKPNFEIYVKYSRALMDILREYSPLVEQYSIDEAFVDMTGTKGLFGEPIKVAYQIKDRIYNELGFTVNIGISTNKLLAKMASDFKKPNLVHTLFNEEIPHKMWPLPVGNLLFVGKSAEKTLRLLGIKTIGDLAKADVKLLKMHLKKKGEIIYRYANGMDDKNIETQVRPFKGYSNSTTIPYDVDTVENAKPILLSLCETVGARLRADDMESSCISVSLVNYDFAHSSKQMTLGKNTSSTQELYEYACEIFEKLWDHKTPIRQLGVHATKLASRQIHQMSLFEQGSLLTPVSGNKTLKQKDFQYEKQERLEKLDRAIDAIRHKYGEDSVKRATFIKSKLEHMPGTLSKEKKHHEY